MSPEDWEREDVKSICEGCKRFGMCSAMLVSSMIVDGGCWLKEAKE